jgi:hypothetical protein
MITKATTFHHPAFTWKKKTLSTDTDQVATADASGLGFAPGEWPITISIVGLSETRKFEYLRRCQDYAVYHYNNRDGKHQQLFIWND